MTIIRWEPARELHTIQQEMNRLFGSFFDAPDGAGAAVQVRRWVPAMDLVEEGDEFVLRADLPGVEEKDVKVELEDNLLTITGERSSEHGERKDGYYRIERASGSFKRSLTVPDGVAAESVAAHFENGVLTVRIPKPAQPQPRRVEISVSEKAPVIEGAAGEDA